MLDDFKQAKFVFLTTFPDYGEENSRPMTNFNEDPYSMMWFPTDRDTRKVEDIPEEPEGADNLPELKGKPILWDRGSGRVRRQEGDRRKAEVVVPLLASPQRRRFREPFPSERSPPGLMIINVYP